MPSVLNLPYDSLLSAQINSILLTINPHGRNQSFDVILTASLHEHIGIVAHIKKVYQVLIVAGLAGF